MGKAAPLPISKFSVVPEQSQHSHARLSEDETIEIALFESFSYAYRVEQVVRSLQDYCIDPDAPNQEIVTRAVSLPLALLGGMVARRPALAFAIKELANQPPLSQAQLEVEVAVARERLSLSAMQAVPIREWDEQMHLGNRFARLFGADHTVYFKSRRGSRA